MGHLKYLVEGGKDAIKRYVTTPFTGDDSLTNEIVKSWEFDAVGTKRFKVIGAQRDFSNKIRSPEKSVLYIVAHSAATMMKIGDSKGNVLKPDKFVEWFADERNAPKDLLCLKIWACFSGSNGFARTVKTHLNKRGYKTIVVGYNQATGGPSDMLDSKDDDGHKHMWRVEDGKRKEMISRGKLAQVIFDV